MEAEIEFHLGLAFQSEFGNESKKTPLGCISPVIS